MSLFFAIAVVISVQCLVQGLYCIIMAIVLALLFTCVVTASTLCKLILIMTCNLNVIMLSSKSTYVLPLLSIETHRLLIFILYCTYAVNQTSMWIIDCISLSASVVTAQILFEIPELCFALTELYVMNNYNHTYTQSYRVSQFASF